MLLNVYSGTIGPLKCVLIRGVSMCPLGGVPSAVSTAYRNKTHEVTLNLNYICSYVNTQPIVV